MTGICYFASLEEMEGRRLEAFLNKEHHDTTLEWLPELKYGSPVRPLSVLKSGFLPKKVGPRK